MEEVHRKFIFGKLEIRKFIISDYLYLASYIIAVICYLYISKYYQEGKFGICLLISFAVGFHTISSPFGLRFRNIYFSIIWLILSLVLLIDNYFLAFIPISTFILYHVIRIIFWEKNNREFIPYQSGKGKMFRFKSYFEDRSGDLTDKKYTKILLGIGILIIGYCLIQMIGFKN